MAKASDSCVGQPQSPRSSRSPGSSSSSAWSERTALLAAGYALRFGAGAAAGSSSDSDSAPRRLGDARAAAAARRRKGVHRRTSGRRGRTTHRGPPVHLFPALFLLLLCAFAAVLAWNLTGGDCAMAWVCNVLGGAQEAYPDVWARNAGPYAPWASQLARATTGSTELPDGCVVDQVSVLHRHTGRFPTPHAGAALRITLAKLADRGVRVPTNRPEFAFLSYTDLNLTDWRWGELTEQGRRAAYESGRRLAAQYPALPVFTRTTDAGRVAETSRFWLQGFAGGEFEDPLPDGSLEANVSIPEGKNMNNTLSVHSCRAYEAADPPPGQAEFAAVTKRLQPAADRLNHILAPQPPLVAADIPRLASMCGFDTTARGGPDPRAWGWSKRWCRLLTRDEWEAAGYAADVARWYAVGDGGGQWARTMGSGWVAELAARLTDRAPSKRIATSVNHTLDADPATFPRGGARLFVDFTHDNEMVEILTAMGMRRLRTKMPTGRVPLDAATRRWVLARLVPFGARWAVERVVCPADIEQGDDDPVTVYRGRAYPPARRAVLEGGGDNVTGSGSGTAPKTKTYVRVLINERPTHIDHMACRSTAFHESHYLCDLPAFLESQAWSLGEADWRQCDVEEA